MIFRQKLVYNIGVYNLSKINIAIVDIYTEIKKWFSQDVIFINPTKNTINTFLVWFFIINWIIFSEQMYENDWLMKNKRNLFILTRKY